MTPESIPNPILETTSAELSLKIENQNSKIENSFKPRRKRGPQSKIAQLPGHQRMLVNQLLDQDKTYDEIVEELAKFGVQLNTDNISKWYTGPYQEYLTALDWQDELHQLRDHAYSFSQDGDIRFQEGVVQIGLTQVFRDIKENRFKDDPANSLRVLNSLARLSREALVIRKYADQAAKQKTVELKQLDEDRDLSDNECQLMVDRMDRVFRARRRKSINSSVGMESSPSPSKSERSRREEAASGSSSSSIPQANPSDPGHASVDGLAAPTSPPMASEQRRDSDDGAPVAPKPTGEAGHTPNIFRPFALIGGSKSKIKNLNSKISREPCPSCRKPLPALLPTGERPSTHCQQCGTPLRPPGSLLEYCPGCNNLLPELQPDGTRASPRCPSCGKSLPPPPGAPKSDEGGSSSSSFSYSSSIPETTPPLPSTNTSSESPVVADSVPQSEIKIQNSKIENPAYCPRCVACLLPEYSDSPPYEACPSCGLSFLEHAQPPPLAA